MKTHEQGNAADTNVENPEHVFWSGNPSKKPGAYTTHGNATSPLPNGTSNPTTKKKMFEKTEHPQGGIS